MPSPVDAFANDVFQGAFLGAIGTRTRNSLTHTALTDFPFRTRCVFGEGIFELLFQLGIELIFLLEYHCMLFSIGIFFRLIGRFFS